MVTGGEPLLRRELTLDLVERLTAAGVDHPQHERLVRRRGDGRPARPSGARVHVSVDGVSAELHDASRGLRGSWRRAVDAIDMLVSRGVRVQVVHVVTPRNEDTFEELLEQMRILAPSSLRITPVGRIGAAAREGQWAVDVSALRRSIDRFDSTDRPRLLLNDTVAGTVVAVDRAPQAFLVRPNGAFLADSQHPFSFGHAARQPLTDCWSGLRQGWRSERVEGWRRGARNPRQAAERDLVAYRDDEEAVAGVAPEHGSTRRTGRELEKALELLATKAPDFPDDGRGDVSSATGRVRDLALSRRYRLAPVRWSGSSSGRRMVRVVGSGKVKALNASAGLVMDALDGGTAGDAIAALRRANPGIERDRFEVDGLRAVGALVEAGIAVPALAPRDDMAMAGDEGSLSGLPD